MKNYEKPVLEKLSIAQDQAISAFDSLWSGFEAIGGGGFGGITSYRAGSGTVVE